MFNTFIGLVANASMLLGLSVIHDAIALRPSRFPRFQKIYIGVMLGLIGLALMRNPWIFGYGIIFDTRTILLSISGLFFGFIPTLVAVIITAIYRIAQGGGGVYMGVLTIVSSSGLGLLWRYLHQKYERNYNFIELYTLGQLTHLTMVGLMFTLPKLQQADVIRNIALPVLIIYPFATVLLGKLHALHISRLEEKQKLRESEELFNSIANTSPPIWLAGLDKGCYWFNESWLQFRGRTLEEEQGNGWAEGVHPDDLKHCFKIFTEHFDKRESFLMEYRLKRYDGMYRWVMDRGKPRYSKDGIFLGFIGSCIDNTDLRTAEAILKNTEEEYAMFFNNAMDLFCIANTDGYFMRLNKQWESTLGYTLEELLSKPYYEFVHPDDLKPTVNATTDLRDQRTILSFTNRYRHKNGSYRWIEWRSYPAGYRMYGAARDVTERIEREKEILKLNRDLEDKVEERTAELQQVNAELESFIDSVAHDLKAPLRAIDGFNKIILEDYDHCIDDAGKKLLHRILENTSRMDLLISDLLSFSKISKMEISAVSLDMKKLVESILDNELSPEQKNKISIVVGELPIAKGDKKLIRQVWENLISNAIKFTAPKIDAQITISGYNTGIQNVYVVKDNGVGFNPQYKKSIFDLFSRVHSEDEFSGTGVGLAIVKRVIEMHGGRVWAESTMGRGADFYFSFPVK